MSIYEEYLSQQNGNGNGHKKAFVLEQPKSPEEIARATILSSMPKLRRECSKDRRLKKWVGAKWLFDKLTDASFYHNYGGDGFGKIFISVKDLSRIFGHEEDTLRVWRNKLIETGWIWYQKMSPKSCWGISGVTRQPELFGPGWEVARSMAKASAEAKPNPSAPPEGNGDFADSSGKTQFTRFGEPKPSAQGTEGLGSDSRSLRLEEPKGSVQTADGAGYQNRSARLPKPKGSVSETEGTTLQQPKPSAPKAEGEGYIGETPIGDRSLGANEGGSLPPHLVEFERGLRGMFRSKAEKLKSQLEEQRKRIDPSDRGALEDICQRIELVETKLLGGKPIPKRKATPARALAAERRELTEAELLECARYAIAGGFGDKLTERQKALLAKAEGRA